ncbi:hypothetical protein, partial [Phenylobacterium sp. Root700]|uniref:terminase small subunit-like protein n=1 Tax=Phenylobacterium sp. Root700 TaxID=1736591 RepID=UPI001910BCB6
MDHTGGAKASQYRREIGKVICARIDAGETIRSIAADPAMPSYATIFRWTKVSPEFAAMYGPVRRLHLGPCMLMRPMFSLSVAAVARW